MFTRKVENQNPKVGLFPSNRNVCLDLTELPNNFHEKNRKSNSQNWIFLRQFAMFVFISQIFGLPTTFLNLFFGLNGSY